MTQSKFITLCLLALSLPLGGCATWHKYRQMPAGQDSKLWRPQGIAALDFAAQVADPDDLVSGRGSETADGRLAADAVDRMRRGRMQALPASSISSVGGSGASGGALPGNSGGAP